MRPRLPRLHAVTDERIARRADLDDRARELAAGGGVGDNLAFHARGHTLTGLEHYELATRLSPSLRSGQARPNALLFVNDRLDVALALGGKAAGVQLHVGSLAPEDARRLEPKWWVGKSVHDLAEAEAARAEGADYLLVGPVFPTASHPERPALGLDQLAAIAALGPPVIAIGGVTAENAKAVRAAGAHGVAAIRALWDAIEPAAAARRMLEELA
jgi:thiamine-phosphate pyrophosphorylase